MQKKVKKKGGKNEKEMLFIRDNIFLFVTSIFATQIHVVGEVFSTYSG